MHKSIRAFGAVLVLFAGCAAPAQPVATDTMHDDLPGGTIRGIVTDDAQVPIENAALGLPELGRTAKTGTSGRFEFQAVPAGTWTISVFALGYHKQSTKVDMENAETKDITLQLESFSDPDLGYHSSTTRHGRIFCGADWRVDAPAPQGPLAACGALYTTPFQDLDSFAVLFDLSSDNVSAVREIVFETQWLPTQALGTGLRVFWEAYQEITPTYQFTEDLRTFVHAQGPSPLWASADHVDILDNVTGKRPAPKHCSADGPCKFWARVFPHADTLGAASPVDFSTYVDQSYTHHVTEFYGQPAPDGFTLLSA